MIKNKIVRYVSPDGLQVFHDTTLAGDGTPNNQLRVSGKLKLINYTPSGPGDTYGKLGQLTWDDDFLYVKTSAGWAGASLTLLV